MAVPYQYQRDGGREWLSLTLCCITSCHSAHYTRLRTEDNILLRNIESQQKKKKIHHV